MVKIAHLITGLETGGAQTSLLRLLTGLKGSEFGSIVISLKPEDSLSGTFVQAGIEAYHLGMGKDLLAICRGLIRLFRILRDYSPDIIHGWMYHGNLLALIGSQVVPHRPVVIWGIRHSLENLRREKKSTAWVIRLGATLSGKVDRIVYNSYCSADQHRRLGYTTIGWVVIPNGFDFQRFRPSEEARQWLRKEMIGLSEGQVLVGIVARYHPMKAHDIFLKAAGVVAKRMEAVRFLLVGKGVDTANVRISSLIRENGLEGKVYLLGERFDIDRIYPGLDLMCSSSSFGESFPNVVGEAMASGVPCVVTNVGDSAELVKDCGKVVPPGDAETLAATLIEMIQSSPESRAEMGLRGRKRVESFSCEKMVERFASLYKSLMVERGFPEVITKRRNGDGPSGSQKPQVREAKGTMDISERRKHT